MLLEFLLAQFVEFQNSGQLKKPDSAKFPDKLKPNIKNTELFGLSTSAQSY